MLRAGLLDDDPVRRDEVAAALAGDPALAKADTFWQRAVEELDTPESTGTRTSYQLRARRREALRGTSRMEASRGPWPRVALATAFSMLLALSVTWFFGNSITSPAPSNQGVVAAGGEDLKEITDNLDFYVWMENHGGVEPVMRKGS